MTESVGATEHARERLGEPMMPRELAAQLLGAAVVLGAAVLLIALERPGAVDPVDAVLLVLAIALLGRLEFEIGSGFTVPTQLAFVPMLFVLPPAVVPLAVVAALLLDRLPDLLRGRWHGQRLLCSVGDAAYAIGPAAVFVAAGIESPSLTDWPIYLLALGLQLAGDMASSTWRESMAHGVAPSLQLHRVWGVWLVDLALSPIGLLTAYATVLQPQAYLLVLPIVSLIPVFARERRERIGREIELSAAYRGTANLLGDVLTADHEYTGVHSQEVVVLALAIADELGLDADERRLVEFGAMLHDIGKINIPDRILNKPGPLDEEEWAIMRQHTIDGQRMLDRVGGALHEVGRVVRSSHEHFDGRGYPDGLAGFAIPLASRIVTVADAFDAMTTRRPYRQPLSHSVALAELRAAEGTQFDPLVVGAAAAALARMGAPPGATPLRRLPFTSGPSPRALRAGG